MLVANSFDLWQRDAFFSAAEEVQESADILESAYRTWIRVKREGNSCDLDELRRELQTALGTAKWQLEEFERAIKSSYGNCRDHNKMARHQQFVVAIESQISRVEDELRESLNEEGKQTFRWVNLDEDERDDLAMFLSGSSSSGTPTKNTRNESIKPSISLTKENLFKKLDSDYAVDTSSSSMEVNIQTKGLTSVSDDVVINMGLPNCATELGAREAVENMNCEANRTCSTKRTRVSPKFGTLSIMIPDENEQMRALQPTIEATPKEKGSRTSNFLQLGGIHCLNKLIRGTSGLNSRVQSSRRLQFSSSRRLIIVLMLLFFLLVPYFIHSS